MTQITGTLHPPEGQAVTLRFQALNAALQILPGFVYFQTLEAGLYDFEIPAGPYRFHYYGHNLLSRPYQITVPDQGPTTLAALLGYQDPIDPTPEPETIEVLQTWTNSEFEVTA